MTNFLYHCSVRNEHLSIDETRNCKFYDEGYCNSLDDECPAESVFSDLEGFVIEPGSLITHDSVKKSLRHLRMQDGE